MCYSPKFFSKNVLFDKFCSIFNWLWVRSSEGKFCLNFYLLLVCGKTYSKLHTFETICMLKCNCVRFIIIIIIIMFIFFFFCWVVRLLLFWLILILCLLMNFLDKFLCEAFNQTMFSLVWAITIFKTTMSYNAKLNKSKRNDP